MVLGRKWEWWFWDPRGGLI